MGSQDLFSTVPEPPRPLSSDELERYARLGILEAVLFAICPRCGHTRRSDLCAAAHPAPAKRRASGGDRRQPWQPRPPRQRGT